jgi:long-chain-fatty-acid--CoA ligase ACSBG
MGYYKNEKATREAIDQRGFLHSGDLGRIDPNGSLYITGRIKELIVTAGGENVAPVIIEDMIKERMKFISNVVVIGDKRKFLVCLITIKAKPDAQNNPTDQVLEEASAILKNEGVTETSVREIIKNPKLSQIISKEIEETNKKAVSRVSTVKKFKLLPVDFCIGRDEMTSTLKLKRNIIHQHYSREIEEMYLEPNL